MSARISSRLSNSPMLLARELLRRILSFPAAGNQLFEPDNNGQDGQVGRHCSVEFFRIDDQIDLHHAFATEQARVVVNDRTAFAFAANGPLQIVRLLVVARRYFPPSDVER